MTQAVRLQLRRQKGFRLDEHSRAANGLPARVVTRPGLFGNIFSVTETTPATEAVRSFRRFLRTWSDTQILEAARAEVMARNALVGIALIVLRNRLRANVWHLRGHNLACFCRPDRPCHADVYLDLLATDMPERWKAKYPALCEEVKS